MQQYEMTKSIGQAHSAALYNKLIKTQHQILISQLSKLQNLNNLITAAKEKRQSQHKNKIMYYSQTQQLLQEQIRRKDQLISKLGIIGVQNLPVQVDAAQIQL